MQRQNREWDTSFCSPSPKLLRSGCLGQGLSRWKVSKIFSISILCVPSSRDGSRKECQEKRCMLLKELHKSHSFTPLCPLQLPGLFFVDQVHSQILSTHFCLPMPQPSYYILMFPVCSGISRQPRTRDGEVSTLLLFISLSLALFSLQVVFFLSSLKSSYTRLDLMNK